MSWLNLILLLLKVADKLFAHLHDSKMMQAGEDRQVAKALTQMSARSTTIKEIEEQFGKMSIEDIKKYLDQEGDYRD